MIRVACLGAGYFSQFHRDGWARIDGVTCVGVADRDLTKAHATGLPAFDTLADMLAQTDPDLLDIILPPDAQATAIRLAIDHGVKTIICQKPFCASLAEARTMAALAEDAGTRLIIHENFRFQPWYRAIKSAIDAGDIGDVLQATFRLRPGDGSGPDAYLARQPYFQTMPRFLIHETGVHLIDTFRYLFGDPTALYADLRRVNPAIAGEDAGYMLFDFATGMRAVFDGNRCLDHPATNTRCTMGEGLFEGTKGALTLNGNGAVFLRKQGETTLREILPPNTSDNFGGDCTYALQAHVIAALQGKAPFENSATDYLAVIEIELAVYQSAELGTKLDLPRHDPNAP